jgi:hypothetical protein
MEQAAAPSSAKVAIKWALIYILVAIVITYAIEIAKLGINSPIKYLGYVPLVACLVLAQKEYRGLHGGYMTFGDGFVTGLLYSVFAGLLFGVFMYLYLAFLSPEALTQILDAQKQAMIDKGAPSDQIDKTTEIMSKFGAILISIGLVFWYVVLGTIISLITAAIFKKERSAYDPEPTV